MKSNEFWGLFINPFRKVAGWQAFGLGLVFVGVMGVVGTLAHVAFDGALDMHLTDNLTYAQSFLYLGISLASVVLVMWLAGVMIAKQVRFIDILGTMTLAKAPFLLLAVVGLFTTAPDLTQITQNPMAVFSSVSLSFIVLLVLSLPVMVWSIALMYNGFKVSCGVQGSKLTLAFILGLFTAEIVSKLALYWLL